MHLRRHIIGQRKMNNKKIDSLFYTNIENYEPVENFFNDLENYAKHGINPVYIVNRPLGEKKYKYNYEKAFVLLIPKHKLIFINYGSNQEALFPDTRRRL